MLDSQRFKKPVFKSNQSFVPKCRNYLFLISVNLEVQLYQLKKIGIYHTNHCEDHLFSSKLDDDILLIAVMDGCTMGIESHFASCLISKILQKLSKEFYYQSFIKKEEKTLEEILKEITSKLFKELQIVQQQLALDKYELLSTLILGIVDCKSKEAEIITIGDGLIVCNGKFIEYEQDDQPDYLAYHLSENFEDWFLQQEQKLSLCHIEDLSISTDGIFSFTHFNNRNYPEMEKYHIFEMLFQNLKGFQNENMLRSKLMEIEEDWGLKAGDDLGIIRLVI